MHLRWNRTPASRVRFRTETREAAPRQVRERAKTRHERDTGTRMFADIADDKGKGRLHQQIDENLKRVYEEALTEEIPDRFKKLIDRLRSRESEE